MYSNMITFLILGIILHARGQGQGYTQTVLPPVITASPFPDGSINRYFKSGDSVTLKCNASGTPKPNITWYKKGFSEEETPFDTNLPNIKVLPDGSLMIEPMTALDEGSYFCKAHTEVDGILLGKAISVDVRLVRAVVGRYPPSAVQTYLVNVGEFLMLPCQEVKSVPEAKYSWTIAESEDDKSAQLLTVDRRMNIDFQGNLPNERIYFPV